MTAKKVELSGKLSKREKIVAVSIAIQLVITRKLIVSAKSLNREFEAIPGYPNDYSSVVFCYDT